MKSFIARFNGSATACILLSLWACSAAAQPTFEVTPCPETVDATECGYVKVPSDHADPGGEQFRLFVSVVRGSETKAPDPVVFLTGGPGELSAPYPGLLGKQQLYGDRDFLTFDQRGVGLSEPAPTCRAYDAFLKTPPVVFDEAEAQRQLNILKGCGEALNRRVDLGLFTTTQSAADVEDIRQALGYGAINLIGGSYGTRLAQEVMRGYPDMLRAVVLDSVIPPQINRPVDTVASAHTALVRFFEACKKDKACSKTHPDLEATYARLYTALEQTPLAYTFRGDKAELDGDTLQALVFLSLYTPVTIAELSTLISTLDVGEVARLDDSTVLKIVEALAGGSVNFMNFFAVECRGEVAFSDPDDLRAAYKTFPRFEGTLGTGVGISSPKIFELCDAWGLTEPSAAENELLRSDVPTLLLAGYFDPVTPPENLVLAAEGLSHAYAYTFPDQAHGAGLSSPCALGMVQAFIGDPTNEPDAGCIEGARPVLTSE